MPDIVEFYDREIEAENLENYPKEEVEQAF